MGLRKVGHFATNLDRKEIAVGTAIAR